MLAVSTAVITRAYTWRQHWRRIFPHAAGLLIARNTLHNVHVLSESKGHSNINGDVRHKAEIFHVRDILIGRSINHRALFVPDIPRRQVYTPRAQQQIENDTVPRAERRNF